MLFPFQLSWSPPHFCMENTTAVRPPGGEAERACMVWPGPGAGVGAGVPGAQPALCVRELNGADECARGLVVLSHGLQKERPNLGHLSSRAGCSGCKVTGAVAELLQSLGTWGHTNPSCLYCDRVGSEA